jgi:hypothetical protein
MYSLKTTFEKEQDKISGLLDVDLHEDRFYEFINRVIGKEVNVQTHPFRT